MSKLIQMMNTLAQSCIGYRVLVLRPQKQGEAHEQVLHEHVLQVLLSPTSTPDASLK